MPFSKMLSISEPLVSITDLVAYLSMVLTCGSFRTIFSTVSFFKIGYCSAMLTLFSISCCTCIWPQKLKILLLITFSKPFTKLNATIITATLSVVAPIARRIIKREKVFCRLKAIRFAIKADIFNRHIFGIFQK